MNAGVASLIHCQRCGWTLGERVGAFVIIRHAKREVIAGQVVSIKCEKCGTLWRPT
jgi:hypothetical protein